MTLDQRVRSTGGLLPPTAEDFRSFGGSPIVLTKAGEAWMLLAVVKL